MSRVLVTEENYRDIEDKFGLKIDHLIRLKNKTDIENTLLHKEIDKLQKLNMLA
jgi:hypothetical protein